jgi:hypothetical protein
MSKTLFGSLAPALMFLHSALALAQQPSNESAHIAYTMSAGPLYISQDATILERCTSCERVRRSGHACHRGPDRQHQTQCAPIQTPCSFSWISSLTDNQ